jgi:hypothetical protein
VVDVEVLVVVPVVGGVPMPVVEVVQVVVMGDRAVAAALTVDVVVFGQVVLPMRRVIHWRITFPSLPCDGSVGGTANPLRRRTQGPEGTGDNDARSNMNRVR